MVHGVRKSCLSDCLAHYTARAAAFQARDSKQWVDFSVAARQAVAVHLITQHPGTPSKVPTPSWTMQYYDQPYLDSPTRGLPSTTRAKYLTSNLSKPPWRTTPVVTLIRKWARIGKQDSRTYGARQNSDRGKGWRTWSERLARRGELATVSFRPGHSAGAGKETHFRRVWSRLAGSPSCANVVATPRTTRHRRTWGVEQLAPCCIAEKSCIRWKIGYSDPMGGRALSGVAEHGWPTASCDFELRDAAVTGDLPCAGVSGRRTRNRIAKSSQGH